MPAVVTHHAFGHAGGSGGIQDIQRIRSSHRHTIMRLGFGRHLIPIQIPPVYHRGGFHGPLFDNTIVRFGVGHLDGLIKQRFVGDNPFDFDTTGSGHNRLGLGIVDAHRQFFGRKPAKNHGMHRADTGAGQHGNQRLRNHRHVDQDPIPLGHALGGQRAGKQRHLIPQLIIGEFFDGIGNRGVINYRILFTPAVFDMIVQCIIAGVHLPAAKPAKKRFIGIIQDLVPLFVPVAVFGCRPPETVRVFNGLLVGDFIRVCHNDSPFL